MLMCYCIWYTLIGFPLTRNSNAQAAPNCCFNAGLKKKNGDYMRIGRLETGKRWLNDWLLMNA